MIHTGLYLTRLQMVCVTYRQYCSRASFAFVSFCDTTVDLQAIFDDVSTKSADFHAKISQNSRMFNDIIRRPLIYRFSSKSSDRCGQHRQKLIYEPKRKYDRSQWPRGLRRRSAAARLLRLWVRIPPGAWTFVCCECCVCCQVEVSATS